MRFFRKELPDINDTVITKVVGENSLGYNCELLEYNNVNGFIPLTKLIKGKAYRSKMLKIGEIVPLIVMSIEVSDDENIKTVMLSREKLDEKDTEQIMLNYKTHQQINKFVNELFSMYNNFYQKNNLIRHFETIESLMDHIIWDLYEEEEEDDDNSGPVQIYHNILQYPKILFDDEIFDNIFIDKAVQHFENRIIRKDLTLEMNIFLLVTDENAIYKMRDILNINNINTDPKYKIKIFMMSPPNYKLQIDGPEKEKCLELAKSATELILSKTKDNFKGKIKIDDIKIIKESEIEIKYVGEKDIEKLLRD